MKIKIFHWFQKHHEWITIPLQIILLLVVSYQMDERGLTVYDAGVLQKILIGILLFTIVLAGVRIAKRLYFPTLFKAIDENSDINNRWEGLTKYQLCLLGVIVFVGLAVTFALCFPR